MFHFVLKVTCSHFVLKVTFFHFVLRVIHVLLCVEGYVFHFVLKVNTCFTLC